MNNANLKIIFVGGGSGGPVAPLLAVAEVIKHKHPSSELIFVGTHKGVERRLVKNAGYKFIGIASGKLRRYFSLRNIFTPLWVTAGFLQSLKLLLKHRPQAAVGAGGYVQLPLLYAAWILRIPVLIHQQDFQLSLSNRLCAPIAKKITITFQETIHQIPHGLGLFPGSLKAKSKAVWTGNPFRKELAKATRAQGLKQFNLKPDWPTLLVLGGGTGAQALNDFIIRSLPQLTKIVQIIHVTGPGKKTNLRYPNYHPSEFIASIGPAYAAANVVLCRAGLSTITELSNLGKISIIIPMPNSHQEDNAGFLAVLGAAIVARQSDLTTERLVRELRLLLFDVKRQQFLSKNIKRLMPIHSDKKIADIIESLINAPRPKST